MYPLIAALALVPPGFRFGGGRDLALLKALQNDGRTKGPLVAISYQEPIARFAFSTDDRFWSRFQMSSRRQVEGDPSASIALHRGDYPAPAFGGQGENVELEPLETEGLVQGGRVVGQSPEPFRAGDLRRARWSKPLRIHYVFLDVPIVMLPQSATETSFLKTLAAALGATFVDGPAYELKFDPKEFRLRMVPTIERWRKRIQKQGRQRDARAWRYAILREAISAMSDAELSEAFSSPNGHASVSRRSVGLTDAVKDYLEALGDLAVLSTTRPVEKKRADLMQDADLSKPIRVEVYGNMHESVLLVRRAGGTIAL